MPSNPKPTSATLEGFSPPSASVVTIRIDVTAPVNITPFVARQRVTRFLLEEISTQLRAERTSRVRARKKSWPRPA